MPTYEYVCEKCDHVFELFQSMKDDPIEVCPKAQCAKRRWGKGSVRREIGTGGGIIFKGSGFYSTDYRSESYKADAKKDSPSPASTDKKSKDTPKKKGSKSSSNGGSSAKPSKTGD